MTSLSHVTHDDGDNNNATLSLEQEVGQKCAEYANLFENWSFKKNPDSCDLLNYLNDAVLFLAKFVIVPNEVITAVSKECRLNVLKTINFMFQTYHVYPNDRRENRKSIVNTYLLSREIQDTKVLNLSNQFLGNIAVLLSMYIFMIEKCKVTSKFDSISEESDEVRNEAQILYAGFLELAKCFFDTTHKMYEEIELQNGHTMSVYDHLIDSFAGNTEISEQNLNGFQTLYRVITECHSFYGTIVNVEFCKKILLASAFKVKHNNKPGLCSSSYQLITIRPLLLTLSNKICDYFIDMQESELKFEENNGIEQILHIVGIIHTRLFNKDNFGVFLDKHLCVMNTLLNSSSLEKRLCAMNYCTKLCNNITNCCNDNPVTTENYIPNESSYTYMVDTNVMNVEWSFFNLGDLLNCFEKYNILETLYKNIFHAEVIKKSVDVITFYSSLNAINERHIQLIWESLKDKNENEKRIVYDSVIKASMSSKNILHCKNTIFLMENLVCTLSPEEYKEKSFMLFLRNMFLKILKLSKAKIESLNEVHRQKSNNVITIDENNTGFSNNNSSARSSSPLSGTSENVQYTESESNNANKRTVAANAVGSSHNSRIRNPYCSIDDINACFEAYGKMNLSFIFRDDLINTPNRNCIAPISVKNYATDVLIRLIRNQNIFKRNYIDNINSQIIESIKTYKLKPSAGLAIFKALLDTYVEYSTKSSSGNLDDYQIEQFHLVLSKMDEKENIFKMILDGIEHYCSTNKTDQAEVQACCDLLTYLLQNSHYRINRLHITQLWKVTLPKYTDMWVMYLFIYSLTPNMFFENNETSGKEKTLQSIIFKEICSIDISLFSKRSFAAYKSYFYLINSGIMECDTTQVTKNENLTEVSAAFDATVITPKKLFNLNFIGLEKAWQLIKFCPDPNLNSDVKNFLINLYETKSAVASFGLLETRTKLISEVFTHLNLLLQNNNSNSKSNVGSMTSSNHEYSVSTDQIANYTAITNLVDILMLLMEKHEYVNGNKKFSHCIARNIERKSSVKIGYIIELYNNSFTFDADTIPEIQMYPFENVHDIRKKILYLANKNGIIEHCFNRILNEDHIKVTSWSESDFVLRYHKETISSCRDANLPKFNKYNSGNIAEEFNFFNNNEHIAKDQLNLVFIQPLEQNEIIEIDQDDDDNANDSKKANNNFKETVCTAKIDSSKPTVEKPVPLPSETCYILSTSPFFENLFALLKHPYKIVVTKVWALLQRACTSCNLLEQHYNEVKNFNFLKVLGSYSHEDGQNAMKLYTLQIVWKLIFTPSIMPTLPLVYINEEKNIVDFHKVDKWKKMFLKGGGINFIENAIKERLQRLRGHEDLNESKYAIELLHLSVEILLYFINVSLPPTSLKTIPLAEGVESIDFTHQFYNINHLYEMASISINILHTHGVELLEKNPFYKTLLLSATSLLSSTYDLLVTKLVTNGEGQLKPHFIHSFLTTENFMKLIYVIRDCKDSDIRSKLAIFLSHKVLVLKFEDKKHAAVMKYINIGLSGDDVHHFLILMFPLIKTVNHSSKLVYEFLATFRNFSKNFKHIICSGDSKKIKPILQILLDTESAFTKTCEANDKKDLSEPYIAGMLTILHVYLDLLQCMFANGMEFRNTDWKRSLDHLQSMMLDTVLFNFAADAICVTDSKQHAFNVILSLWKLNLNPKTNFSATDIFSKLLQLHGSNNIPQSQWEFSIDKEERDEKVSYIGLYNQGSTCYMNSLMQQFFMIPQFRETILNCDLLTKEDIVLQNERNKKEGKSEVKYGPELINFLYELKKMFAFLKQSPRKSYDPISFVNACRNKPDGFFRLGSDIFDQNDAGEFLSIFLDKLETSLKYAGISKMCRISQNGGSSDHERTGNIRGNASGLINKCFQGEYAHQMIILDDKNRLKERTEPFNQITLEVKNNANVQTSLATLIQDEILQGENSYYDDILEKKVRAIKRLRIKRLPPILVLQLKRFQLNYDTFQKEKLNDKYVFPTTLEMAPFMARVDTSNIENGAKRNTAYKLSGILIHSGGANAGHYYSYIKDRQNPKRKEEVFLQESKNNSRIILNDVWLKFNDDEVDSFDSKNIPQECYGGYAQRFPIVKNAFILFYEQEETLNNIFSVNNNDTDKSARKVVVSDSTGVVIIKDNNKRRKIEASNMVDKALFSVNKPIEICNNEDNFGIPSKIQKEIELDKINFRKLSTLYDGYYASFLGDAIQNLFTEDIEMPDGSLEKRKFQLFEICTQYVFNVMLYSSSKVVRKHDNAFLLFLTKSMKQSYTINEWFLKWFFSNSSRNGKKEGCRLKLFLLQCTIASSRAFVSQLLSSAVKSIVNASAFQFIEDDYIQCEGGEYSKVGLAAGNWLDSDDSLNDDANDEDYMNDETYAYTDDEESSEYDGSENNSNFSSGRRISDDKNNETGTKHSVQVDTETCITTSDVDVKNLASNGDGCSNQTLFEVNNDIDDSASSGDDDEEGDIEILTNIASANSLRGLADAVINDEIDGGTKGNNNKVNDHVINISEKAQSVVGRFVSIWFSMLEESAINHWRRFDQYFSCLFNILYDGIIDKYKLQQLFNIVHSQYAVARMINIYLNEQSPQDLMALSTCMRDIPSMEYKNQSANLYPLINLISLLSLTKRSVKFENLRDEQYPVNAWNEPKIDYCKDLDDKKYSKYFTLRLDTIQVPYFSEDFLSSSEFLEKLAEDSLKLIVKWKSNPRDALPLNLLYFKAANNTANSCVIMNSLLNILNLPFQHDDIIHSMEIIKQLLFMADDEKLAKPIQASRVREALFFRGRFHNPFSLQIEETTSFFQQVANYYNIYESASIFLDNLRQAQNASRATIRENENKVQYLHRLVVDCYNFITDLYLCEYEHFQTEIVEGLDFLQNNNQQLVATCRKIRSDVAKFIEQAMAERQRENLRGGVGMTAEGSGHETKSGNCSSSSASKIEIV
jgi:ubiquitin C-terminal hydrolase